MSTPWGRLFAGRSGARTATAARSPMFAEQELSALRYEELDQTVRASTTLVGITLSY